ncbi:phosphoglycerate kinase [Marinibaculum pumilum]|uniref:Phosphoglycerate kinase n=1 Tax=Marinibaculum pumilum TaxID=1766165 RepID=A0ABV7L6V8_9PROT
MSQAAKSPDRRNGIDPGFDTLDDLDIAGRRVLVRVDLNVPRDGAHVRETARIERIRDTIEELAGQGAKVVLLSHFDRPKGKVVPEMSLRHILSAMEDCLGRRIAFCPESVGPTAEEAVAALPPGEILLLENLRFHAEEEANDPGFADALARLGDVYVNDAFSAAHRAHASTAALAERLPAAAGRLMEAELRAVIGALEHPQRPLMALVGGAKVSTKLAVLSHLVRKVDRLVIGGGMANTFLYAQGHDIGRSLCERDMADTAREILANADAAGCRILLPVDAVVATEFAPGAASHAVALDAVPADAMILDIGPQSVAALKAELAEVKTLVWNGPLGAFEVPPFDTGTNAVAAEAASLTRAGRLQSIAGGGDTLAALAAAGAADDFTYLSTAGGAFLEWLEGRELPGIAALAAARARNS